MKKTLFLTLSLVAGLGFLANNACHAKKTAPAPIEMHHAAPHVQPEVDVAAPIQKSKKTSCEGASCYSMAGLTKWFNQTKNWFLGLFGIETAKKKAKKAKNNACAATACKTDCSSSDMCCPAK